MNGAVFWLLGTSGFVSGVGILGYQMFQYLKTGAWMPLSVVDALMKVSDNPWLQRPDDWIGVHSILCSTPLSLAAFGIGTFFVMAAASD